MKQYSKIVTFIHGFAPIVAAFAGAVTQTIEIHDGYQKGPIPMKHHKTTRLLAAGLVFVFLAGLANIQATAQNRKPRDISKSTPPKQTSNRQPAGSGGQPSSLGQRSGGLLGPSEGSASHPVTPGNKSGGAGSPGRNTDSQSDNFGPQVGKTLTTDKSGTRGGESGASSDTSTRRNDKTSDKPGTTDKTGASANKPGQPGPISANPEVTRTSSGAGAGGGSTKPTQVTKPIPHGHPVPQPVDTVRPQLTTKQTPEGYVKTAPSGAVREKMEKGPDGEHTQHFTPTGRVENEVVKKTDGALQTIQYASNGKVAREEVINKDGRAVTTHQFGRDGTPRAQETVHYDSQHNPVSKTVVVRNTTLIKNTTIINNRVERNYIHGHYGFVYRPDYLVVAPVLVSWYNPYWYGTGGVVIAHPFHYAWGWESYDWYRRYHGSYWVSYEVYPAPSYWATDWLIAGYAADHFAASLSAAQAQADARLAREEADKARQAAEEAKDQAEIADARQAQAQSELRAQQAEGRAARAERQEAALGKPNPNVAPIDRETKETLRAQIEQTVAEKKLFADEVAKGGTPVPPDLSKALADPKHIYPVARSISVISAADQKSAGTLTEGDLLRLEPGQEDILARADENTLVTMRVITSKGEDEEAKAGSLVSISLKSLQDFDSEFRAKLDLALAEADKNQEQFKSGALVSSN